MSNYWPRWLPTFARLLWVGYDPMMASCRHLKYFLSPGHCVPMSAYILPQLSSGEDSLSITEQEGSWFGINIKKKI